MSLIILKIKTLLFCSSTKIWLSSFLFIFLFLIFSQLPFPFLLSSPKNKIIPRLGEWAGLWTCFYLHTSSFHVQWTITCEALQTIIHGKTTITRRILIHARDLHEEDLFQGGQHVFSFLFLFGFSEGFKVGQLSIGHRHHFNYTFSNNSQQRLDSYQLFSLAIC